MTVNDVFCFLNSKFPVNTACDFDNVGILIGDKNREVLNVLITLDCTIDAIDFAKINKCNLIITHHPIIFNPCKNILAGSVQYEAIKNDISVISMHTNLDIGVDGVNDTLTSKLGFTNYYKKEMSDGFLLNIAETSDISSTDLAKKIATSLNTRVKYVQSSKTIKRILICCGSGSNYINEVIFNDCQALITGDVKHNHFIDAQNLDIALFDAGHFETENIIIDKLKNILSKEFSDLNYYLYDIKKIRYEG